MLKREFKQKLLPIVSKFNLTSAKPKPTSLKNFYQKFDEIFQL